MVAARHPAPFVFAVLLLSAACGDDDAVATRDAGMLASDASVVHPSAEPALPAEPAAPIAPALPVLTPCPTGWREVLEGEVTLCEPWPEGGRRECADGEAHFPGGAGCEPVGSACPAGDYPSDLSTDGTVVFVRAGGASGDGTIAAPYATIAEALAAATTGTTIALAPGTYAEAIAVPEGVTVRGACAATTVLAPAAGPEPAVSLVDRSSLRDVRVAPTGRAGVRVRSGEARLESVVVSGAQYEGVRVDGGALLAARSLAVENVGPNALGRAAGGIVALAGSSVDLERVVVRGAVGFGIVASYAPTMLRAVDSAVYGTQADAVSEMSGFGIAIVWGATASLARVATEGNAGVGIAVIGEGSSATGDHLVARRTTVARDGTGYGMHAGRLASLSVSRSLVEQDALGGVLCASGATMQIADSVVRDHRPFGVSAEERCSLTIDRALVARSGDASIALLFGSIADLRDLTVRDTTDGPVPGVYGRGIHVQDRSTVTMARVLVERAMEAGVGVLSSTATIEDLEVRSVEGGPALSSGIWTVESTTSIRRAAIERVADLGAIILRGAATFEDVALRDTGTTLRRTDQIGIFADDAADVSLARICLERTGDSGLRAERGSTMRARDVVVRGPPGPTQRAGVQIANGSSGTIERVLVEDVKNNALYVTTEPEYPSATVVASDVTVRRVGIPIDVDANIAVLAAMSSTLTLERVRVEDVLGFGVGAYIGASLDARTISVARVGGGTLSEGGQGGGSAVFAAVDSRLRIEDFVIEAAALCGVQVGAGSELDAMTGEVRGCTIGACVAPGYDVARLSTGVTYRDNGDVLSATELPLPTIAESPAAP